MSNPINQQQSSQILQTQHSERDKDIQFSKENPFNSIASKTHLTLSPQITPSEIKGGSAVSYIKSCFPDSPRAAKAACFCAGLGLCVKGAGAFLLLKFLKPLVVGAISGGTAGAGAGALGGAVVGATAGAAAGAGVGALPGLLAGATGGAIVFGFLGALFGAYNSVSSANDDPVNQDHNNYAHDEADLASMKKDNAIVSGIFQEAMNCFAAALSDSPPQKTA